MKKLFYSLLLLSSATLFAQKNVSAKFAVAGDTVGTVDLFTNSYKNTIEGTRSYKSAAELPQNLKKFSFIADNGLVEYKLKKNQGALDKTTLSDLNNRYGLANGTPVFIDGYEFKNTNLTVFEEMLSKVEVNDSHGLKAISVTTKK
ncbi:hypothetical protein SAMN05421856_10252 [Chryseobacterium taichungense]|uniref:Uncharacterized protein n=1 Tax=Chryseobacterium taichungense TaxID=295069 RepID=A0A1H7WWP6_9FLAO|nr:hypothetical protein [Chryseobacterium taichungense]SEM26030.1 hypothetical protein SAMN05421856_10252 [Chryseobacterium taichungense]